MIKVMASILNDSMVYVKQRFGERRRFDIEKYRISLYNTI